MKRSLSSFIALSLAFATVTAQKLADADQVIGRLDLRSQSATRLTEDIYRSNPALYGEMYDFSITDASIDYRHVSRGHNATMPWQGNKSQDIRAGVDAYMTLSRTLTVWGGASYESGKTKGVRWNSVVDYDRVAPYVIADSIGGNVTAQRYCFEGGVAVRLGRWNIGADAAYRAEIDYRGRDPRIKDVVSDLKISLGAMRRVGEWYIGLSGTATIYNQDGDVEFYNPINNIRTHLLTGLGSTYQRFSGGGTETTAYEGLGFYGALQLAQSQCDGLKFSLSGGRETMKQRLRDYNNLDLTETENYLLATNILYRFPRIVTVSIDGNWQRRVGTENLFGTAVGSFYPKISSRQNYFVDQVDARLCLPLEVLAHKGWTLEVVPSGKYTYLRRFLRQPNRLFEQYYITPAIDCMLKWRSSASCLWTLDLGYDRVMSHDIKHRLTGIDPDRDLGNAVLQELDILSASSTGIRGSLRCDFKVPTLPLLYVKAQCNRRHLQHMSSSDLTHISCTLGATF